MKFTKQVPMNASADKVWDVLGHDFCVHNFISSKHQK